MKNLKRDNNTNTNANLVEPIKLELYEEDDYMNVRINDELKYRLVSFRNQNDGSIKIKLWTGHVGTGYKLTQEPSYLNRDDIVLTLKRK